MIAFVAFVVGAVQGAPGSPEKDAAQRYTQAWENGDFGAMYRELNQASKASTSINDFVLAYHEAEGDGDAALARSRLAPRRLRRRRGRRWCRSRSKPARSPSARSKPTSTCPMTKAASPGARTSSSPGCGADEHLENQIELAPRAPILAADGTALAEGPADAREHPLGSSVDRRHRGSRHRRRRRPAGADAARLLCRHAGRRQRPRAGLQRPARRQAGRLAARRLRQRPAPPARSPRASPGPGRR